MNQAIIEQLIKLFGPAILKLIMDQVNKPKPIATPGNPVPKPEQSDDNFPDDSIPAPLAPIARVVAKLGRAAYSKQRFPEEFTHENPFGLIRNLNEIEAGAANIPYGSKAWIDLTPYDKNGKEILRDAFIGAGLSYKTEHHVGDASIKGDGALPDGTPKPYETVDTENVGNGISAWESSVGCLHQVKLHTEGSRECYGKLDGVESNHFTIKVS